MLAAGTALWLATAPVARAQDGSTAEQTIATMTKLWGEHPGLRANHAKGVVVEGSFTPTPEAARLSKATLFQGGPVPVTARFSNSTGLPALADGAPEANPHGMSLKFRSADGEMDVVANSLGFFPVANGEEFLELLRAVAASPAGTPSPTPIERFMAAHPAAPKAFATASTPSSFGREQYNGVNALVLVDRAGIRTPFRYRFVPVAGVEHLTSDEAAKRPPNYLMEELPARLARGEAVAFKVLAQIAGPGDSTRDSTVPWPEDRRLADLGTVTLSKAVPDSATAEKGLLFMPNTLPDGVESSDDPLIDARVQAYAISFGRRSQ
jgi:catalase